MARFIEKNEAQLIKNSRNMVPSTLTALRSVFTDLSELALMLKLPRLSAPELNAVDRRLKDDTSSPAARRNDDPRRRTSDLKRSWSVESIAAAVAESTESTSHVADAELARLIRRILRRRSAAACGDSSASMDVPMVLAVPTSVEHDSRDPRLLSQVQRLR